MMNFIKEHKLATASLGILALQVGVVSSMFHSDHVRDEQLNAAIERDPVQFLKNGPDSEVRYRFIAAKHLSDDQTNALALECFSKDRSNIWFWRDTYDLLNCKRIQPEDVVKIFHKAHPDLRVEQASALEFECINLGKHGTKIDGTPRALMLTVKKI